VALAATGRDLAVRSLPNGFIDILRVDWVSR
jgi:hypothetical protein